MFLLLLLLFFFAPTDYVCHHQQTVGTKAGLQTRLPELNRVSFDFKILSLFEQAESCLPKYI